MRSAVHRLHLVACILASLGVACATPVDVAFDAEEDFSRYRSWSWLPDGERVVHAPDGDPAALDRKLVRALERELWTRGLTRSHGRADLQIGVDLRVERKFETVRRLGAARHLTSFHQQGAFEVQVVENTTHAYEECRLAIVITDGDDQRVIWRGVRVARCADECAPELEGVVSSLLQDFPPAGPPEP